MRTATDLFRARLKHPTMGVSFREVLASDPCVYCCVWPMRSREGERMTLEHITPKSDGGPDSWKNLAAAHCTCNQARSSIPLLWYFLYRAKAVDLVGKKFRKQREQLRRALGVYRVL